MFKIRNYKMCFDVWGLLLFLVVMLPNFIWFAVPAANDILRNESRTPTIDLIASVFQVLMVSALCLLTNKDRRKPVKRSLLISISTLIVLYYGGWWLYYAGNTNPAVILDLCIAPCLVFVLFSIAKKNAIALIAANLFMVCHVLYGIVNFIILDLLRN